MEVLGKVVWVKVVKHAYKAQFEANLRKILGFFA